MRAALVAEYRKLVTTRLWWVMLLAMVVMMVMFSAAFAGAMAVPAEQGGLGAPAGTEIPPAQAALSVYALAAGFGYVFPAVVGVLSVTGELRHQTITPTLLAEPRRSVVVAAKLVAALAVGAVFGVVGTLATAGAGGAVLALTGADAALTEPEVLRGLALSVVALAIWCAVGVGFGAVLTNQVAAVVVLIAFNQLVEPILRLIVGAVEGGATVTRFLPGAAAEALVGSSIYTALGAGDLLPWWQGGLVLLAYAVVLATVGRLTAFRRDVT